jgi:hypothetical protein
VGVAGRSRLLNSGSEHRSSSTRPRASTPLDLPGVQVDLLRTLIARSPSVAFVGLGRSAPSLIATKHRVRAQLSAMGFGRDDLKASSRGSTFPFCSHDSSS